MTIRVDISLHFTDSNLNVGLALFANLSQNKPIANARYAAKGAA